MEEAIIKKILPHSQDAEEAVLGCMLMDSEAISVVSDMLSSEDFYQSNYGIIFEGMLELYSKGNAVDLITLQNRLIEKNVPAEYCNVPFFSKLLDSVATAANVKDYAQIVSQKATLRRLIKVTSDISVKCYIQKDNVETILEDTEKMVFDIVQKRGATDLVPISKIVVNVLDKIEQASKQRGNVTGVSTGFIDLDYNTSGLQPSDLILIAARPSIGKTAFALNLAQHIVFREKIPTVIFSLEMSSEQIVNRVLSLESLVDSQAIRTGNLQSSDWEKLVESAGVIGSSGLIIDDTPSISVAELRSKCRKLKLEKNIGCIIIDYLQLMTGSSRTESRQQEISEISRALKAIAKELNIPVVALSQLSRAPELRQDHRPILSDLRESGAIEQDADVVMLLYRDEYYNKDTEFKNQLEVIIAKQRNGPVGTVKLAWLSQYTKFANLEKSHRND